MVVWCLLLDFVWYMDGDIEMVWVVSWDGKILMRRGQERILYRVPKWARELYEERTLKILCWLDIGEVNINLDNIEIVPQEEIMILNDVYGGV